MATLRIIISGLVYFHRQADTLWVFCMAPPVKPGALGSDIHEHRTRIYFQPGTTIAGAWPAVQEFGFDEASKLIEEIAKPFGDAIAMNNRNFLEISSRDLSLKGFKPGALDFTHQQVDRQFSRVASVDDFLTKPGLSAALDPGLLAEPYNSDRRIAARLKITDFKGQVSTHLQWGEHAGSQNPIYVPTIIDYEETWSFQRKMAHSVAITLSFRDVAQLESRRLGHDDQPATMQFSATQGSAQEIFLFTDYEKTHDAPSPGPGNNHFLAYYDLRQGIALNRRNELPRPKQTQPHIIGDSSCSPAQGGP